VEQAPQPLATPGRSSQGKVLQAGVMSQLGVDEQASRISTGLRDLDLVLGGGIVQGGVVLLAGQPGIGKSTLLLQLSAQAATAAKVLYVSGEESAGQVAMRAQRLGVDGGDTLSFVASTSADDVAATIAAGDYQLVVVDSIQTMSLQEVSSASGSASQITNAGNAIIRAAKASGSAVILVGHVTKEGSIAGPKVLEHLVDVVLSFDGDRYGGFKVVRAVKNRYGSTSEVAIFEMQQTGLTPVDNPSAALLAERHTADGSVVFAAMEGSRPLLVEIQALVNATNFGYPKRTASGFDLNRLNLLVAVLERRTKLNLSDKDIYINVVGGMKLQDPAADLAVAMAIASAAAGRTLDEGCVVFGELGLGGEVRQVAHADRRVAEAQKLGFTSAIGPRSRNDFITQVRDLRSALRSYLQ
jgi:DNA repair protein radA